MDSVSETNLGNSKKNKNVLTRDSADTNILRGKKRYVYSCKSSDDATAELIENIITKCNSKMSGSEIDFSSLVAYALKLIKDDDINALQESSLSDEERAMDELKKFNTKNGTSYTLFEFVINGLGKKIKKVAVQ